MSQATMSLLDNVIIISALLLNGNSNMFVESTKQGQVIILGNGIGLFNEGAGYDTSSSTNQNSKGYPSSSARPSSPIAGHGAQDRGFGSNQKNRRGLDGGLTVLHVSGFNDGKSGYEYRNRNNVQNVHHLQDVTPLDGPNENAQGRETRKNPPVSSHVAIPLPDSQTTNDGFKIQGKGGLKQEISYSGQQKSQMVSTSFNKGPSGGWEPDNSAGSRVFYNGQQGVVSFQSEPQKGRQNFQSNAKGGFESSDGDSHKGRGGSIDYSKGENSFKTGQGNYGDLSVNRYDGNIHPTGKGVSSNKDQNVVVPGKQNRTPKRRVIVIPVLKHVAVVEHVPVIEHIKVIADDDTLQGLNGKTLSLGRSSVYGGQLGLNYNDGDDIAQGLSVDDLQSFKGLSVNNALNGGRKEYFEVGSLNTGMKNLPPAGTDSNKGSSIQNFGTTPRAKDYGGGGSQHDAFDGFGKGSDAVNVPDVGVDNVNEYRSGGKTFFIFHTSQSGKGQFTPTDNTGGGGGGGGGGGKGGQKGSDAGSHGNVYHGGNDGPNVFYGNGKSNQFQTSDFKSQQSGHDGGFDPRGYSAGDTVKGSQNSKSGYQSGNGFSGFNPGPSISHEAKGSQGDSLGGQKGINSGFQVDQGYVDTGKGDSSSWRGISHSKNGGINKGTPAGLGANYNRGVSNVYSGKGGPADPKGTDFNNIQIGAHQNKGGVSQAFNKNSQHPQNAFPPAVAVPNDSFGFNSKGGIAGGGGDVKGMNFNPIPGKNFDNQQVSQGNVVEGLDLRLLETLLAASADSGKNKFNNAGIQQQQLQTGKKSYSGGSNGGQKGNTKDFRSNKRSTDDLVVKSADGADPGGFGGEMWW